MCESGEGVPKDYSKALEWYKKAGDSGYFSAYFAIGELFLKGRGVNRDINEAIFWFKKAASHGDERAKNTLDLMNVYGSGTLKDYSTTIESLKKSAHLGNSSAQYGLSLLYRADDGIQRDLLEAEKWFKLASNQNNNLSKENLKELGFQVDKNNQLEEIGMANSKNIDLTNNTLIKKEVDNTSKNFYFDSLEAIRRRLLDLTSRNGLLSYKHPKAKCVRLIDELPNQIYDVLSNEGSFTFIPVPEPTEDELIQAGLLKYEGEKKERKIQEYPTAEQWAKHLGFITSFELPDAYDEETKHQDTNLQTLFYAPELESRLRNIRNIAEGSIEETGVNVLYLNIGFLEWYESPISDTARLAPLFTLPVQLERGNLDKKSGVYRYTIKLKDDNLISNITLREMLSNDFNLALPPIEDDLAPEEYFKLIQDTLLQHQPRWKIKKQASLVLLNFAKQAMYQDLDPLNWPEGFNIADHPLIKLFFSQNQGDQEEGNLSYETEHDIDTLENIHEQYPLIYDADSSQHSAIVDVVEGKSLVIEGPPGSGKSQTITNIIAASIANGKKVLFVAEKMAALNVVKDRLDKAGLGDFCLELHSHKTNKQKILNGLNTRLHKQSSFQDPKELDASILRYEDLKDRLNKYAYKINSKWKNTELTIHEILNKYTRLYDKYRINPEDITIEGLNGETLTLVKQNELNDFANMLDSIYAQVSAQTSDGKIESHYWFGVGSSTLNSHQSQEVLNALILWQQNLQLLHDDWINTFEEIPSLNKISVYLNCISELPEPIGGEELGKLSFYQDNQQEIKDWLNLYSKSYTFISILRKHVFDDFILKEDTAKILENIIKLFSSLNAPYSRSIGMLIQDKKEAANFYALIALINNKLDSFKLNVPDSFSILLTPSSKSLNEIGKVCKFIDQLPAELWKFKGEVFDDSDLDSVIPKISAYTNKITEIHNKLNNDVNFDLLPKTSELIRLNTTINNGGMFKWLSSKWRNARKALLALSKNLANKSQFLDFISELIVYSEQSDFLSKIKDENPKLAHLINGVDTNAIAIATLRKWYQDIRSEFGIGFSERVAYANNLFALNRNTAFALSEAYRLELKNDIDEFNKFMEYFKSKYPQNTLSNDSDELLHLPKSSLSILLKSLTNICDELSTIVRDTNLDINWILDFDKGLKKLRADLEVWNKTSLTEDIKVNDMSLSITLDGYSEVHVASINNTLKISEATSLNPFVRDRIVADSSALNYLKILEDAKRIRLLNNQACLASSKFFELADVDFFKWQVNTTPTIESLLEKNTNALMNPAWLSSWTEYNQLKKRLYQQGFERVISLLEGAQANSHDLKDIVGLTICYQLANEIFKENEDLANFTGLEQTAIQERFNEYDAAIIKLQRQKIAFRASRKAPPIGINSGKISEHSEVSLIRHEVTKKTRHIAVRKLLKRAGSAIQTLKPCFMMSPMSVAQYLEPGNFDFDLVIMDEASQIKPEDALGAIARGTTFVVVGDPKQLPPTSFFNKILEDEDEEDMVGLQDSESILESVMSIFKTRRLRWHYRSKHESLIAFSNKHFYDSDLVLFPSPFKTSDEFGVKLHKVIRGRFNNRRNIEEAQEVARCAAKHLLDNPKESIGIVAMNAEQRDEIERQLDQLSKDRPEIAEAIEINKESPDPIFIKNLENVQGDERDVIYISMTYGPEQIGGKTMQRFGPINSDVGWRRLNVLFTRSKKRMHIFTSMASWDVVSDSNRGVRSLRAFLEYAEKGHLHNTIVTNKPADSDFELSVMKFLEDNGFSCEPQLGVAGFFLDLAVRDPGNPGRFLMGIECDGATYHSAKSARDRDHLRQEILEGLGWTIRRIWSTDWFRNPEAQIKPILDELKELRSHKTNSDEDVNNGQLLEPEKMSVEDRAIEEETSYIDDVTDLYSAAIINGHITFQEATNHVEQQLKDFGLSLEDIKQYLQDAFDRATAELGKEEALNQSEILLEQDIGIKERLIRFDNEVIKTEFPKTEAGKRLLRPEMLEALLEHLPTSKAEFQEVIPAYLRTGTVTYEAKFLDDILSLIADYA
jgi:superfamily I DNA and/or RNA helicase/very-short-patch-repair endonuclease